MNDGSNLTGILERAQRGDVKAAAELLPLVYSELRRLAAAYMTREGAAQTLQPTALVHEAWLRLVGNGAPAFDNQGHFFSAAAEAMRRILVEKARRRARLRHGGRLSRVELEDLDVAAVESDDTILAVSQSLERLAAIDPTAAELIRLRFFGGLTNLEAARVLGLAERTAKRTWAYARAWLFEDLRRTS